HLATYVMLALVGWMLSLGPTVRAFRTSFGGGIYPAALPPFSMLRAPARFGSVWVLAVGVMAASGLSWIESRSSRRTPRAAIIAAIVVMANVELINSPFGLTTIPPLPPVHKWLADHPGGAVVELPFHANTWPLYRAWFHQH